MAKGPLGGWQSADNLFHKYRSAFLWMIAIGTIMFLLSLLAVFWDSLTTTTILLIIVASIVFFAIMYALSRRLVRGVVPTTWLKVDMPPREVVVLIEQVLDLEGVPNTRHTYKGYARAGRNPTVRAGIQGLPDELNGYALDLWDGVRVITVSPEPPGGSRTDIVVYPRIGEHEEVMDRVRARIEIPFMQDYPDM